MMNCYSTIVFFQSILKFTFFKKENGAIYLSSPREARAFDELRRYHTRPLRLKWALENVHFGKKFFWT